MYLSDLEIIGFKSFAGKTKFKFADGLTAVVGPNGCGKSNVVDSIRWVLGEQKTSVLRSESMDNVIFNGSKSRKPLGMAEVSLTLQNTKNILPTEYSEVTITRRLFRNGDSHYLLNNTNCRLRDILDLFMDTGIGSDSYSVIELKMVEQILSGKAEERRHLLEEAAGVVRYKVRRKEANRKLKTVQNDMLRVMDILQEVEKQVNSLSRQAAKTRKYNKLVEAMKQLEVALLTHEFAHIKETADANESQLNGFIEKKVGINSGMNENDDTIASLRSELEKIVSNHNEARREESELTQVITQKSKEVAVDKEKLSSSGLSEQRIEKEVAEAKQSIESLSVAIENERKKLEEAKSNAGNFVEELTELIEKRDEAKENVDDIREGVNSLNEEVIGLGNRVSSIKSTIDKNEKKREVLENQIDAGEEEIDSLKESGEEIDEKIVALEQRRAELDEMHKVAETELESGQKRREELGETINSLQNDLNNKKGDLSQKKASKGFLEGLVGELDESSKYLSKSDKWSYQGERLQLAELIGADEEHRVAIDAALGSASAWFVVDDKENANSALELLHSSKKGKAAFLCRNMIPSLDAPSGIESTDGTIGWISEIVRVDDDIKNALRHLLAGTALVQDIDSAWNALENEHISKAVTLSGEFVTASGVVRGGSVSKSEGILVGKKERILKIQKEIDAFQEEIDGLEESLASAKSEYQEININELTAVVRRAEIEINNNEREISQLNYKKESLDNKIDMIGVNLERFHTDMAEIDRESEELNSELGEVETRYQSAQEELKSNQIELRNAEEKLATQQEELKESEMRKVRLDEDIKNIEREIERLGNEKNSIERRIKYLTEEQGSNKKNIDLLGQEIDLLEKVLDDLCNKLDEAKSKREYIAQKMSELQEQIKQHSDEAISLRKQFDKALENVHQQELGLSELNTQLSNLRERAYDGYDIELDDHKFELEEEFSIGSNKEELTNLKNKLSSIGNVNFMALEEYEAQNERMKFFKVQIDDLEKAEKNLVDTIEEINTTAIQKFSETFNTVNENFTRLFKTLFGEDGDATLILGEGDPLEANIEIQAKPPGKRPHSIEMLSGGEKTLTAIAMLFAIYLVKPSPFCILDEVDAPLDDANIDRYINLIRKFSNNTQFLIVTHNKKSMTASDSLYGITMEEQGISKVVSVKLDKGN
jgi:chromosome segregation protein